MKYTDCYADDGSWYNAWDGQSHGGGVPQNFVMDRDGNVRWFGVGYSAGNPAYDPTGSGGAIDELLGTSFP